MVAPPAAAPRMSSNPVIGIDFGTQSCVLGVAKRGGVEIILNESSKRKTL